MPLGLRNKAPNSNFTVERRYLFPSKALSTDPESKLRRRQHINESSLRKVITMAQVNAKIEKRSPSHSASFVCDSFAWEWGWYSNGAWSIRLCRHKDNSNLYTHFAKRGQCSNKPTKKLLLVQIDSLVKGNDEVNSQDSGHLIGNNNVSHETTNWCWPSAIY